MDAKNFGGLIGQVCGPPLTSNVRAMITEENLNTWEQLQSKLGSLIESLGERSEKLLFRGQSDSGWKIETTVERKLEPPITLSKYYRFAYTAKPKLETFVNTTWDIPTPPQYDRWLNEKDTLTYYDMPGYDYLAYLRHHGFPSPFIDWTDSPYIAAFFAFNNCTHADNDYVSVYCYLEHANYGKVRSSNEAGIYVFGPYVKVHKRHVLQQSRYSICVELDKENNQIFSNHELVLVSCQV